MIKNMVFDVGNVLLSYDPYRILSTLSGDPAVREEVYTAVFRSPEWAMADAGSIDDAGLRAAAIARCPQHEALIRRVMDTWHEDLPPMPGMLPLVKRLAERFPLYIISNFATRFHAIEDRAPFSLMQGIVVSADEKIVKPDVRIFQICLTRYGLNPAECLFIDDLPANIQGAQNAGMHGHVFTDAPTLEAHLCTRNLL